MARLVLYSRPGCHLCDDARVVLERIGEPFDEIDIDSSTTRALITATCPGRL